MTLQLNVTFRDNFVADNSHRLEELVAKNVLATGRIDVGLKPRLLLYIWFCNNGVVCLLQLHPELIHPVIILVKQIGPRSIAVTSCLQAFPS